MKNISLLRSKYCNTIFLVVVIGVFLLPNNSLATGVTADNIIKLTNSERKNIGISPLVSNQLLARAAYEKARAIFDSQSFAHQIGDKKFSDWIKGAGYNYLYAGENLAISFETSEDIIQAWMNSPFHKKNLVNGDFSQIGVATLQGIWQGTETTLAVQIFGTPVWAAERLEPIANDDSLAANPLLLGVNSENLLTHSASKILSADDNAESEGKIAMPDRETNPPATLFMKADFDPSGAQKTVQYLQSAVFCLMLAFYIGLNYIRHYNI